MINRLTFMAVAAVTLLAGCSFIPVYERPEAPVPTLYPGVRASSEATSTTAAAALPWQVYFSDPTLQTLIQLALANNRDLRVASLNVEQARAQFQIRRADEYPSVALSANASRAPATGTGNMMNAFNIGVVVSAWEIDFFGRIASLKEQALAQYLASEQGRSAAQTSLVTAVAQGWLNLLADEELLTLSRSTLASREESRRLTELRMEAGVTSELDFRQAESLVQSARATLAQQQRQRALDENALALLLGQTLPDAIKTSLAGATLTGTASTTALPAGLPSDLVNHRPDIRQAEQQLIAANANIGAARAAFFPRIALTAQAGTASSELSGLFKNGAWGFSVAPSLLVPLLDAGKNRANLDASEAARSIAMAQYEKTIQVAFREVADALASTAALEHQAEAQQRQADAETVRLRLANLRYSHGVSSYLDLLDAQRSLFTTQQALVQVHLAQRLNQVATYRALGGGSF